MTELRQLLERLRHLDIKVRVERGQLRLNAPRGALSPELRSQIADRKTALVELLGQAPEMAPEDGIQPIPRTGPLPLSFAQRRMWFLGQLEAQDAAYNIPMPVRFDGILDGIALERSLAAVVARHEVLRTRFRAEQGKPIQTLAEERNLRLSLSDLSHLPRRCREREAQRLVDAMAVFPFEMEGGVLWHGHLVRLKSNVHFFLFTMHHIVSDGWSVGILTDELVANYRAFTAGRTTPFAPLPIQYADFAAWQNQRLSGRKLQALIDYWKVRLAQAPDLLKLATDKPRPQLQRFRGGSVHWRLADARTLLRLQALNQRYGTTLFMTLLSGFAMLLARYSNQTDVLIGTPIAGRNRKELEPLIGFFVNTLVIRADLARESRFTTLLASVREETLGAYTHQELPFEKLVEELQPDRSLSHTPLFQVMFQMLNVPHGGGTLPGLTVRPVAAEQVTAKFDLNLAVTELPDGLECGLEFNRDLFAEETVKRMGSHFGNLLAGIASDPARQLCRYSMFAEAERLALLETWNQTQVEIPFRSNISTVFEEQVSQVPDRIAAVSGECYVTYGFLADECCSLATQLAQQGVGPETLVALVAERDLRFLVTMLAIFKAGGVYLPLDPFYPEHRLHLLISQSGASHLITTQPFADLLHGAIASLEAGLRPQILFYEQLRKLPINPACPAWPGIGESHLAYVIFTSGSTGTPNGAMVTHGGMLNHLYAKTADLRLGETDSVAQNASQSFDISVWQFLVALVNGGRTEVFDDQVARDPVLLLRKTAERQVTVLEVVPSLLRLMLEETERSSRCDLSKLRWLVPTGEALPPSLGAAWLHRYPAIPLVNAYGPTECSDDVTHGFIDHPPEEHRVNMPIGYPIANTRIHILDPRLEPVPLRVPGELYVAGNGLGRGYLGRGAHTATRFIPDPFNGEAGGRLYKTGDLACYLPHGEIEYLGRVDHQIKLRGFRIELGEIESVLGRWELVGDVAVLMRTSDRGGKRLVAYVVAPSLSAEKGPETHDRFTAFLKDKLPDYMVPSRFQILESMPLTPNGKIDRKALALLKEQDSAVPVGAVFGSSEEEILAAIWSQVLGREAVGPHDDFFDLGGHSLLLFQVMSRIRETFSVEIPLRSMFATTHLSALATLVRETRLGDQIDATPPLRPYLGEGPTPLSFAQQRLWVLDRLEGLGATYNIPITLRLRGPLDLHLLERCFCEIVSRQQSLRTIFPASDGLARQLVLPVSARSIAIVDLDGAEPVKESATNLVTAEVLRPFDLERGPLMRVLVVRLAAGDHLLAVTLHHIISDGWSNDIFSHELTTLYGAWLRGQENPLAPLPIQYGDFSHWQRQYLQGDVLEAQRSYWVEQLQGAPPLLMLPTDRPRPAVQGFKGHVESFVIAGSRVPMMKDLSQRSQVTLFMSVLGVFDLLLATYSGQSDLVVGTPVANRGRRETEALIGFFVNNLCIRVNLKGNPSFRQLLRRVRDVTLQAYAHQDLPFEQVVDHVQPQRNLSHSPIFQTMLVFENKTPVSRGLPGTFAEPVQWQQDTAKFDLTLYLKEGAHGLMGSMEYRTDLFDSGTVRRMCGHYQNLFRAVVEHPDKPLGFMDLLSPEEQRHFWSNPTAVPLNPGGVHGVFETMVARNPDSLAVVEGSRHVSYRQLNNRANRLARTLASRYSYSEAPVGIYLGRSLDAVVAILAVVKCRRPYLPLDPAYPVQRIRTMIADADPAAVIVDDKYGDRLRSETCPLVHFDREAPVVAKQPSGDLGLAVDPSDLAYMIYTSGSTGKPKGVMIPHGGLWNLATWHHRAMELIVEDRATQLAAPAFDASVWELWPYLTAGAAVVVLDQLLLDDPEDLADFLVSRAITITFLPTPLAETLLSVPWTHKRGPRYLLTGGDKLHGYPPKGLPFQLINNYGPTENSVVASSGPVAEAAGQRESPNLGVAIDGVQILVANPFGVLLPGGLPGELCIGGSSLARGYYGDVAKTATMFVPNPYAEVPGSRMYRTGDKARVHGDGKLQFLGRMDQQVKIRGFRIELGEIETVLAGHPDLAEAVVRVLDSDIGEPKGPKRLVAYVVPTAAENPLAAGIEEDGETLSQKGSELLRHYLKDQLPDYMVPSLFIPLTALPLTANGKVDVTALPVPNQVLPSGAEPFAPPSTPIEKILARIWADQLGLDKVGLADNFFDLGGDSILSIRVTALIKQEGYAIKPRQLFESQTIAELAPRLKPLKNRPVARDTTTGQAPLIPVQAYFFERPLPQPEMLTISQLFQAPGVTDPGILEAAFGKVLEHHDGLRVRFQKDGETWVQVFQPTSETLPFTVLDFHGIPESLRSQAVTDAAIQIQNGLNLEAGVVVRLALFRMGVDRRGAPLPVRLLLVAHHLVMDGFSLPLMIADLQTAYFQNLRLEALRLPPKSTSLREWARGLKRYSSTDAALAELDYWTHPKNHLAPPLPMDFDSGKGANIRGSTTSLGVSLDQERTRLVIQELTRNYKVSMDSVMMTALLMAFHRWAHVLAIRVDLVGHGREPLLEETELSRTLGCLATIYPVYLEMDPRRSPVANLLSVRDQLESLPNQGIGYGILRHLTPDQKVREAMNRLPQAEIHFNYVGHRAGKGPDNPVFLPAPESIEREHNHQVERPWLFNIHGGTAGGRLFLEWNYSANLYRPETVARLARYYLDALISMVTHSPVNLPRATKALAASTFQSAKKQVTSGRTHGPRN